MALVILDTDIVIDVHGGSVAGYLADIFRKPRPCIGGWGDPGFAGEPSTFSFLMAGIGERTPISQTSHNL